MNALPFTAFDLIVGGVLLISVVAAVTRGFVRELLSLASWVGALLAAWYLYAPVRPLVFEAVGNDLIADLGTAVGVFLVPYLGLRLLTAAIARRVSDSALAGADRLLALVYGAARAGFVVCAVYLAALVMLEDAPLPGWVARAWSKPYVEQGARALGRLLPEGFLDGTAAALGQATAGAPVAERGYREDANRALEQLVREVK